MTAGQVGCRSIDISPDGETVVWFADETGDELGRWMAAPYTSGEARQLLPGMAPAWESGFAWGGQMILIGLAEDSGFTILTTSLRASPNTRRIYHHRQEAYALALSRDDRYALVACSERGDTIHPDLRVLGADDGSLVGHLSSNGQRHLGAAGFRPTPGDPCVAVNEDQAGHTRPALWWPRRSEFKRLTTGLRGELEALDWTRDGRSLLLRQLLDGRHRLWMLELESGKVSRIQSPSGTVSAAGLRHDGTVWALCESAARAGRTLELPGQREVVKLPGPRPPRATALSNWRYLTTDGQPLHGFLAAPSSPGPHPTVIWVHGGPHSHLDDSYRPSLAALVDQGLLVAAPNYRGSTGYGSAHMDHLIGNPGFPEVEDVVQGVADLVARGLTDPAQVVLMGASWGGYITLLGVGLHPEMFAAGVARVPVADYVLAFEEESAALKAMDRALFGGDPADRPELYRQRSPITYAHRVRAPLLIQAGENDSRCPYRQVEVYVQRLQEMGKAVTFHHYPAGHSAMVIEQDIQLTQQTIEFLASVLSLRKGD
ncbi:MAG TPA: alpha/beta fold hydrolase [Candidatus Dormibacteraeota bacterium]|nr:alpha/beta fold hydrolase [Candidatus Dormibacteraeota bacterium]